MAERAEAARAAAEALRDGRLVALPTETVYGLFASAASADAVRRLAEATAARRPAGSAPPAWHAHSPDFAREALGLAHPLHRRLTRKLLPGPVTFLVERPREDLEALRSRLGAVPGTLHNGREIAVRIPDQPLTLSVLDGAWRAGVPAVADGVAAAGWGDGSRLDKPPPAPIDPQREGSPVGLALDDGPTRYARPSTVVRLLSAGGFEVVSAGVLEERFIRKQVERTVLFVCTGNTCRSPLAEAIARDLLRRSAAAGGPGAEAARLTRVRSAGVGAMEGVPVTPESVTAARKLGIDDPALARHTSHELTRQLLSEADVIYAMTAAHARMVESVAPGARVQTLDPSGEDIPDPVGHPQEVYNRTAERLREAIERRLEEPEP